MDKRPIDIIEDYLNGGARFELKGGGKSGLITCFHGNKKGAKKPWI